MGATVVQDPWALAGQLSTRVVAKQSTTDKLKYVRFFLMLVSDIFVAFMVYLLLCKCVDLEQMIIEPDCTMVYAAQGGARS
jgi:hypothetical protein